VPRRLLHRRAGLFWRRILRGRALRARQERRAVLQRFGWRGDHWRRGATVQAAFVRAFLRKCRENYIHAALDTCGFTTSEDGARALEEADLLLFDIKGLDPGQHFVDTAVYNDVILGNLKRVSAIGKPVIIRFPIVPGHTDSRENIAAVAELLSGLGNILRVDLMAYHVYGTVKYGQLGKEYRLEAERPSEERMNEIKERLEEHGLNVQLGG